MCVRNRIVTAKQQISQWSRWIALVSSMLAAIAPANATEMRTASVLSTQHTHEHWAAQTNAAPLQITGVRLESTDAGGLIVALEVTGDESREPIVKTLGNALIVEIEDAVLALPEDELFQRFSPVDGIALVQVSTLPDNRVEITVTGADAPPTAAVAVDASGLTLTVEPAQAIAETPDELRLQIVVTATRTAEDIQSVPRSVTVITREEITQQTQLTPDLGAALGQLVPGLAPTTGTPSEFGQSLRGRNLFVLIDGVPQSTSRNVFRNLRTIDPDAIERIEVLRGPTAIYGDGATGGVVNIITRAPADSELELESSVGLTSAPANLSGSLGGNFLQYVGGRDSNTDFAFTASYRHTGGFFDGRGNRIPADPNAQGGLADTDTLNLLGKVGVDLTENQRLQIALNYFKTTQDTRFTTDPAILDIPGRQRAQALEGLSLNTPQQTSNTLLNVDYQHSNVLNGELTTQLYYRDYDSRFFPFDARDFPSLGNVIFQSEVESTQFGGRLQFDTPLLDQERLLLTWGADYRQETTLQPLNIFDPVALDESGGLVFTQIDERIWVPPFRQRTLGLFAQANWEISDRFSLLGGIRHERVGVDVDDFTTLAGNSVVGGELTYDATLFNLGGVLDVTEHINLFANFAQGFSLADVGLALRNAPAGFSVETLRPEAQRVDHYEVGIRGRWQPLQASLVGFYNESDLGTTFTAPGEIVRAPERIYGVEATVDASLSDAWRLGGTFTWQEGETDLDLDGDFSPLNGFRIAPIKVTAYVENQTTPGWRNRIQALYSGSRDRFSDETVFGQRAVDSYVTVDYISSLDLGGGVLNIGVQNLLDTDYFPIVSQLQPSELQNAAAPGLTITLGYSFSW